MGKANVFHGGPKGLYGIRVLYSREKIAKRIIKLDAEIKALNTTIITLENELAAQRGLYELAKTTSPAKTFTELAAMATAIITKRGKLDRSLIQRASYIAVRANLQSVPVDPDTMAWCADLTEDLTGEVGTIEPNGEPSRYIIRPGYQGGAVYDKTRDGQVQPLLANTPEGAFFNKALMPGWQKWKPTFRIGTLTFIDKTAHTCSLTLDPVSSREKPQGKSLNINQGTSLSGVPIQYMTCNSVAFAVGDRVVVQFTGQNFNTPKVIGFESNPKPCGIFVKYQIYEDTYVYPQTVVIWDVSKDAVATIPGVTFPCAATDPVYLAWLSRYSMAGSSLSGRMIEEGLSSFYDTETSPVPARWYYSPPPGLQATAAATIVNEGPIGEYGGAPCPRGLHTLTGDSDFLQPAKRGQGAGCYSYVILLPAYPLKITCFRCGGDGQLGGGVTCDYCYGTGLLGCVGQRVSEHKTVHTVQTQLWPDSGPPVPGPIITVSQVLTRIYDYFSPWNVVIPFYVLESVGTAPTGPVLYDPSVEIWSSYFGGAYTDKIIAAVFLLQDKMGYDIDGGGVVSDGEPPVINVVANAKYYEEGSTGKDFFSVAPNAALGQLIKDAVLLAYSLETSQPAADLIAYNVLVNALELN